MSTVPSLPGLAVAEPNNDLAEARWLLNEAKRQARDEAFALLREAAPQRAAIIQFGKRAQRDAVRGMHDHEYITSGEYLTNALVALQADYGEADTEKFSKAYADQVRDYQSAIRGIRDKGAANELANVYRDNPGRLLTAMQEVGSDPEFWSVRPRNDGDTLERMGESFMRGVEDIGERWGALREMVGGPDQTVERDIRAAREAATPTVPENAGFVERNLIGASRSAPFTAGGVAATVAGGLVGSAPGALAAGSVFSGSQMIPDAFIEYRRAGMDEGKARIAALVTGTAESAIEQLIPFDRLAGLVGRPAAQTWRQAIGKSLREAATVFAGENVEEYGQAVSRALTESVADKGLTPDAIRDTIGKLPSGKELADTAAQVAILTAPGQIIGTARNRPIRSEAVKIAMDNSPTLAAAIAESVPSRSQFADALGVDELSVIIPAAERASLVEQAKAKVAAATPQESTETPLPAAQERTAETEGPAVSTEGVAVTEAVPTQAGGVPLPQAAQPQEQASEKVGQTEAQGQGQAPLLEQQSADGGAADTPPVEAAPPPPMGVTSIKNAVVDRERAARGLPPLMTAARRSNPVAFDMAMQKLDDNPNAGAKLVAELIAKPRAMDDIDDSLLLHHKINVRERHHRVIRDLLAARQAGDDAAAAALSKDEAALSAELNTIDEAGKAGGTATGRGLQARKMMAAEDHTLSNMVAQATAAKGENLTPDEVAKVADLSQTIATADAAYEQRLQTAESERATAAAQGELDKIVKENARARRRRSAKKELDQAWRDFENELRGKLFANPLDPDLLLAAGKLAAAYVRVGILKAADFVAQVEERLKRKLTDAEGQAFAQAFREAVDAVPKQFASELPDEYDARDLAKLARKLVKHYVSQGIDELGAILNRVSADLQAVVPSLSKLDALHAVGNYGNYTPPTKDALEKRANELRGQARELSKIEDMLKGQPPKATGQGRTPPDKEQSDMIAAVNKLKRSLRIQQYDPATQLKSALAAIKTRLKNETLRIQERLADKDFSPRKRPEPIELDEQALDLKQKRDEALAEYNRQVEDFRERNRPAIEKLWRKLVSTTNLLRSIQFGLEFSTVGLQGGQRLFSHPIQTGRAIHDMIRAFSSEKAYQREMARVANDPLVKSGLAKRAKLALTEVDAPLTRQEEGYLGRVVGIRPIRAFARGATVFLNRIRLDAFRTMLGAYGADSEPAARAIAAAIGAFTGRGDIGQAERAATLLSTIFLAPRWVASRFQTILGYPLMRGDAKVKRIVAIEYARTLAGLAALYGLYGMAVGAGDDDGPRFEWNPLNSRFGKIRVGRETWVDPTAGLSSVFTFLSRMTMGAVKKDTGEIVPIRGADKPYNERSAWDYAASFLRQKFAPIPGAIASLVSGENPIGQPTGPLEAAVGLVTPITGQNIIDAAKSEGIPETIALSMLAAVGFNMQTRERNEKALIALIQRATADSEPRRKTGESRADYNLRVMKRKADIAETNRLLRQMLTDEQAGELLRKSDLSEAEQRKRRKALRER